MLEREHALHDLVRVLFLADAVHVGVVVAEDGLLRPEVAVAAEDELVLDVLDLHEGREVGHVAADLLEVHRGERDDGVVLHGVREDGVVAQIQQHELVMGLAVLVAVLDLDAQVVDVVGVDVERESVVVGDGAHELVEVHHVDADRYLLRAVVILELAGLEEHVHQHDARGVGGHDLHARLVEVDGGVCQHLLERLDHQLEGRGLDGAELHAVRARSDGIGGVDDLLLVLMSLHIHIRIKTPFQKMHALAVVASLDFIDVHRMIPLFCSVAPCTDACS